MLSFYPQMTCPFNSLTCPSTNYLESNRILIPSKIIYQKRYLTNKFSNSKIYKTPRLKTRIRNPKNLLVIVLKMGQHH